jgi:hypothetical protein
MDFLSFYVNDPSAGSPTDTLLRLLLPLNDKVQSTSPQENFKYLLPERKRLKSSSKDFTGPFNR